MLSGVAVIWGLIIYRLVFDGGLPDSPAVLYSYEDIQLIEEQKDSFKLEKDVIDPFRLDNKYVSSVSNNKKTAHPTHTQKQINRIQRTPEARNPNADRIPNIQYIGFIKNNSIENKKGLILVDQKLHRVEEGEKLIEIEVLKIYRDSITVKTQNQKPKTFLIHK